MRTFLAVIGALFLLFVSAIVGLFAFGWHRMGPLKKEAVAFTDEVLPEILTGWNGAALLDHATPEFRAALTPDRLEELMMSGVSQFGPMTAYRGADCAVTRIEFETGSGEHALAECVAGASFASAQAEIRTSAMKSRGAWKLSSLYVEQAGEGGLQRTAHIRSGRLEVFEASLVRGYFAVSARGGETRIGAGVGGVEAVHVDP